MGTIPIRPLVDRVLDGQLDEILCRYMSEGLSPGQMSLRLASEYQVEVGAHTIKKWLASIHAEAVVTKRTARAAQTVQIAQTVQTARTAMPKPPEPVARAEVDGAWTQISVA